jgi:hypothetical protein
MIFFIICLPGWFLLAGYGIFELGMVFLNIRDLKKDEPPHKGK